VLKREEEKRLEEKRAAERGFDRPTEAKRPQEEKGREAFFKEGQGSEKGSP
jgi:hypothetical protein